MKHWSFLKQGDVVDIIAPASHCPPDNLRHGIEWLGSHGLIPHVPADIIKGDVFFASPLATQLEHLKEAIYSDSKAIWCVRGGYGSMRLIPHLMKMKAPKRPKFFMGFSDITALHLFFNQEWKWPTIHGRNISQMRLDKMDAPDKKQIAKILLGKQKTPLLFKNLIPLNEAAAKERVLKGKITGGNLRILQTSLNTQWELEAKGKILFIEDVGERGYSVDRMLEQMIQARMIDKGIKAMVIGQFTEGEEKNGMNLVPEALERFAKKVSYPVVLGLPCGHGEVNYSLPFNTPSELYLGKKCRLECSLGGL